MWTFYLEEQIFGRVFLNKGKKVLALEPKVRMHDNLIINSNILWGQNQANKQKRKNLGKQFNNKIT